MKGTRGFLLAGTQSGVGKTTLSTGVMGTLKKRGLQVKAFKVGPDYIDPQFHRYITGNPSRNLDSYLLKEDTIKELFHKNLEEEDIAVVEGVMGLYDGLGTQKDEGSSAHVSKILQLPVILVIDGRGVSTSAAAMVLGYKLYDPDINLAGVIINNVSGEKHYSLLKEGIERDTGIKCLGYLRKNNNIQLKSRHLGLIPCDEVPELEEKLEDLVEMVEETVDIEGLLAVAKEIEIKKKEVKPLRAEEITLAYAYDSAFNFYYQDNLDLLKELGCRLIPFSPLKDTGLPEGIDGIYIGGGFPEVFARELEENQGIRRNLYEEAQRGLPIYGECGGFMYLTKAIKTFDGEVYQMAGVFDATAEMTNRLQRFGYCQVSIKENSSFHKEAFTTKAHEFHRGVVIAPSREYVYSVVKKKKEKIIDRWSCGIESYNCLGGFPHIHFYSNPTFINNFLEKCRIYKKEIRGNQL
ncbi:cobyrinate a,c-diamide synthase [Natronincola ferrireducens]|uniref:Cobyrinate a,c-diamide synthase n=1 Tax=Natronincola ferrireducens TaxID=393762 RepID=A0A1G8WR75_9FIRM|nr:cobyrinate a,c-diamide synthase [Natronincola ferrireducens]SDJ80701.1 hydrogenobyrinic acid a,c-diamide synthase (glutamine-hydrolysing) /cobyrinate a,c-diamide synthase [Natronincola ferrireducens]